MKKDARRSGGTSRTGSAPCPTEGSTPRDDGTAGVQSTHSTRSAGVALNGRKAAHPSFSSPSPAALSRRIEIVVRGPAKCGKTRLVKSLEEMLVVARLWGDIGPGTKVEFLEETTPKEVA